MKRIMLIILTIHIIFLSSCLYKNSNEWEVMLVTYSDLGTIKIKSNSIDNLDLDMIKEGYTFVGWYYDENYEKIVTFPFEVYEDITIYAKWEEDNINMYKITFETYSGEPIPCLYVKEGEIPNLPIPQAIDLNFEGWYVNEDFKDENLYTPLPIKSNVKLYAYYGIWDGGSGPYNNKYLEFDTYNEFYQFCEGFKSENDLDIIIFKLDNIDLFAETKYRIKLDYSNDEFLYDGYFKFNYVFLSNSLVATSNGVKYSFYINVNDFNVSKRKIDINNLKYKLKRYFNDNDLIFHYSIYSNDEYLLEFDIVFNSIEEGRLYYYDIFNEINNNIVVI